MDEQERPEETEVEGHMPRAGDPDSPRFAQDDEAAADDEPEVEGHGPRSPRSPR